MLLWAREALASRPLSGAASAIASEIITALISQNVFDSPPWRDVFYHSLCILATRNTVGVGRHRNESIQMGAPAFRGVLSVSGPGAVSPPLSRRGPVPVSGSAPPWWCQVSPAPRPVGGTGEQLLPNGGGKGGLAVASRRFEANAVNIEPGGDVRGRDP